MGLLDMIHDTLKEDKMDSGMESMIQRAEAMDTHSAIESMGGIGSMPTVGYQIYSPQQFLDAFESQQALKNEDPDEDAMEAIASALEETLPDQEPPYDPTEDLDDVINTLSGIDADDGVDPDQPNPEVEMSTDESIMRNMTTPKDVVSAGSDVNQEEGEITE